MNRDRKKIVPLCLICAVVLFLRAGSFSTVHAQTQYQIKSGETVYSIARQYNLSAQEVLRANNINDPTEIGIGTNLLIPNADQANSASVPAKTHAVQKGETYYNIAKRHNLSVTELLKFNNRTTDQVLRIGEALRLSTSVSVVSSTIAPVPSGTAAPIPSSTAAPVPSGTTAPIASSTDSARAQGGRVQAKAVSATAVAARVATTDGNSVWPHGGARKSIDGKFPAVVISASEGDVVRAVTSGRVVHIDSNGAFGRVAFVQAISGHIYIYGGNEDILVEVGERITIGTLIGRVGENRIGNGESQIYFSVWHNNVFIDPHVAPRG